MTTYNSSTQNPQNYHLIVHFTGFSTGSWLTQVVIYDGLNFPLSLPVLIKKSYLKVINLNLLQCSVLFLTFSQSTVCGKPWCLNCMLLLIYALCQSLFLPNCNYFLFPLPSTPIIILSLSLSSHKHSHQIHFKLPLPMGPCPPHSHTYPPFPQKHPIMFSLHLCQSVILLH